MGEFAEIFVNWARDVPVPVEEYVSKFIVKKGQIRDSFTSLVGVNFCSYREKREFELTRELDIVKIELRQRFQPPRAEFFNAYPSTSLTTTSIAWSHCPSATIAFAGRCTRTWTYSSTP